MSGARAFFRKIVTLPIRWLISVNSVPANIEAELGIDKNKPLLYLIQTESITDLIALQKSAAGLGLPDPATSIKFWGKNTNVATF